MVLGAWLAPAACARAVAPETEPAVRFVGRIDLDDPADPRFGWSGGAVLARFTGDSVAVRLADARNYFHVAIDGVTRNSLVADSEEGKTYVLATGLGPGPHLVELWRRTEASGGTTHFQGFVFAEGGALLPPPPPPARRLEIIGDSITCGYGNEGDSPACNFSYATENHYQTYGAIAARALGADLVTVAWSGYGMYRGNSGSEHETIPAIYDRTLPTVAGSTWDFTRYTPHAVVINLGTNDYVRGDPGLPFTRAYVAFVRRLRGHYPHAYILASIGPSLYPRTRVQDAVDLLRGSGERNVGYLEFASVGASGCNSHPGIVLHHVMAGQLVTALRAALSW